ncbi:hypothetical protein ACIQF6_35560 [Kitasatospora sp. NPDC092948]|uniref:hypothetical protein n=1 Tax=Kitasatospora sp. NPDC092948 TaxID=3364088 RepID=UPI00381A2A25
MSYTFDSFANRGEYLSAHYFSEELENTLKKKSADDEGLFTLWTYRETDEHDTQSTPRESVLRLHGEYSSRVRPALAAYDDRDELWGERLTSWHTDLLTALGYRKSDTVLTLHNAGRGYELPVAWHGNGIVALDCGWTDNLDDALDPEDAGRLLHPFKTHEGVISTGEKLAGWLFQSELDEPGGESPRFVLLLCGGVIVLADRATWSEGRYLAASVDAALLRNDTRKTGELALLAALFSHDMLAPRPDGKGRRMDDLLKASRDNAVGVNSELRKGLQRSVEIIANEVLARLKQHEVTPREIEDPERHGLFAKQLTRESLRYLYRILFLLYAEARPELGILPADDSTYEAGYSVARLRELVSRDRKLVDEESKNGFHLHSSLDVLFNKVNYGHRPHGTEPDDDKAAVERSEQRGLRFEPLRSELFDPKAITLIGRGVRDPRSEGDGGTDECPKWLDLRLRNAALHEVLRLLTMKEASVKGRQGGFISYRNLGINQLGAVYEGLMSYTGIIDEERQLAEVAKPGAQQHGDPEKGSWLVPADRLNDYPANTHVVYSAQDAEQHGLRGQKKYDPGTFVYRLAGRDRETSASYYTPESLTKVTVELALKHRLDQERDENGEVVRARASELLRYTICEPALGSGAFLNEAINQVAEAYLKRRQKELGLTLDTSQALEAKQKVKAYIALHNAYGVDLNATGVELAEVSLWLNTMHPGMRAPWFGLHLRRGNSLIGARRWVYAADHLKQERTPAVHTPDRLSFRSAETGAKQPLPTGAVHQFLLPSPGWGAVADAGGDAKKLVEQLAGEQLGALKAWRKAVGTKPKTTGGKSSQLARLQAVAERVEYLWGLVAKRLELSEREIARTIDVWGADRPEDAEEYAFLRRDKEKAGGALPLTKEQVFKDLFEAEGSPYWRLKQVMDAWCALWFWPLDKVGLLDGSDPEYASAPVVALDTLLASGVARVVGDVTPAVEAKPVVVEHGLLFAMPGDQLAFGEGEDEGELVERRVIKKAVPSGRKVTSGPVRRRGVIPLAGLDDWLAFLESMVGTGAVPEGTFAASVDSLTKLKDLEKLVEAEMGMDDARRAVEMRYPWMRTVRDIAAEQGFLHWELEYAGVFAGPGGGFDLQVGNPPWVRPEWKEDAVLAEFEPWFMLTDKPKAEEKALRREDELGQREVQEYLLREATSTVTTASYLASAPVYPLISGSQPDLYRAFMCEVWDHASVGGTAGMVHPDTHFAGDKEAKLRAAAYARLRVHGDFVNAGNRFFPPPVGRSSHFGVHIYGSAGEIAFDSLSWLFTVDTLRMSAAAVVDKDDEDPGVKYRGDWDERPHPKRVIRVTPDTLRRWQRLAGDSGPLEHARLLTPVSTAEDPAIDALGRYPLRLGALEPEITRGYDESGAKKAKFGPGKNVRLIDYNTGIDDQEDYHAASWEDVILKGPQLGVANPMFKQPSQGGGETRGLDPQALVDNAVPESEYLRVAPVGVFLGEQDHWTDWDRYEELLASEKERLAARLAVARKRKVEPEVVAEAEIEEFLRDKAGVPHSRWYRLAWRERVAPDTERALYGALIPPGTTHIHAVRSACFVTSRLTVLAAGFMAALPVDYLLRTAGVGHLDVAQARRLPQAQPDHPLAPTLLIRTLRLNCLTTAYTDLWQELYDPKWPGYEPWAIQWPGMRTELHTVTPSWQRDTPLRTEYARRAALVEIDALVAVWLGIDADTLVAMYRARFPIMQDFDRVTWFDANERKIAGDRYTYGFDQTKEHWQQFEAYQENPEANPVPDGYAAPFYKADREREMREAHAQFTERLSDAVAKGLWDPTTMEVPKP